MTEETNVDIIIFGATGITGKIVVEEFIKFNQNRFTWAVAGRNLQKLQNVLNLISIKTSEDVSKTTIIIADCNDENSLDSMTSKGKVLINCCGPYKQFGEPVVKYCIKNGIHHIDITAEQEYIENIKLKYHESAENKGVYIIPACGFDCVASEFAVIHFAKHFPGVVNSVELYVYLKKTQPIPIGGIGTWKSIVYGVNCWKQNLIKIFKKSLSLVRESNLEPRLKIKFIHRSDVYKNKVAVPFPGADGWVVSETQTLLKDYYNKRPIQFQPYIIFPSVMVLILFLVRGLLSLILAYFHCGKQFLIRHPEFFSHGLLSTEGPSEKTRAASVVHFRLKGKGWTEDIANQFENVCQINIPTNKTMLTKITLTDFGYGFAAKAAILSAVSILTEYDKIPSTGGVLPPGAAFAETKFLERLEENGFCSKIINCDK